MASIDCMELWYLLDREYVRKLVGRGCWTGGDNNEVVEGLEGDS